MSGSFQNAMDSLEREADQPERYCEAFVSVFAIGGAAVSTIGQVLGSETIAATDDVAARLDELQFDLGEGPCWDAMRSAYPVLVPTITDDRPRAVAGLHRVGRQGRREFGVRFPALGRAASFRRSRSVSAEPVTSAMRRPSRPVRWPKSSSRHVLRRALSAIGEDDGDAVSAYSRRLVHQASGVVLAQIDVSADDARLVIQGQAFASSRPMMDVAQDIIDGRRAFHATKEAGSRWRNERRDSAAAARDIREARRHADR